MRIERRYTKDGQSAYAGIEFRLTTSEIKNPDGSVVFRLDNVEVPEFWSQVASDVLAQKYFRKAGVPARLKKVEENSVPSFLWRSIADEDALAALPEKERIIGEQSSKQVFDRLAGTWTYWGWKGGYFDSENDAQAFFDELRFMLAAQMCAPNSPQWFNTGLHWAYGIDGPSQGHYYVDPFTGKLTKSKSAYEHPQPHACFIQSVSDDLVNDGGIMDLWVREFLQAARRRRKTVRRRQVVRPDVVPENRRPRRGRYQVRWHHAARRQDGDRRCRSPGYRNLYRLEGA
jgi:ribonucleoside-diphosphate reductase alpha chain